MEVFLNDLSLHGQFLDLRAFKRAISELMAIRQVAKRFGRELYCHRNVLQVQVTADLGMQQSVGQALTKDEARAVLQWMTRQGPFWEDIRSHTGDDWLECGGEVVTETAMGEAAFSSLHGNARGLVSVDPSNWQRSPILVDWISETERKTATLDNYWNRVALEAVLQSMKTPPASWVDIEKECIERNLRLRFCDDAFAPLSGHPFAPSAAERILFLVATLNRLKGCFHDNGQRTAEGHELYRNFFTGKKEGGGRGALFSDSSDGEKKDFETEMTFKSPDDSRQDLFCPWHGKVQTPQYRVHFSWPISAKEPLYIVYVGPKITRR